MYKVFFVDDEALVIRSLKYCVNWEEYGFSIIGEAYDGITAQEMILEQKPDIVFTDIRMPGMSGLELIQNVRAQNPNILFSIISGYAEFAYVQKAITYEVLGYCLKPFDENEIKALLVKAKQKLDKAKPDLEAELIRLLYNTDWLETNKIKKLLDGAGLTTGEAGGICVAASIGQEKLTLPPEFHALGFKVGKHKFATLFRETRREDFVRLFTGQLPQDVRGIGLSEPCVRYDAILSAIEQASVKADQYFMTGKPGIHAFAQSDGKQLSARQLQLKSALDKRDTKLIEQALDALEAALSSGAFTVMDAFEAYNFAVHSFHSPDAGKFEKGLSDYEQLMEMFDDLHGMFRHLKELSREFTGMSAGQASSGSRSETFNSVLACVNNNYYKEITIHTVSEALNLSPNYVSQLFKKHMKMTFTEYVTNLRVSHASKLLKTTELSVAEIADKAGFSGYYYFTRVYKKITGETPSNYRDKNHSPL